MILVSFNFDMTVGSRAPKQLIYMDIVDAPEAAVVQEAKPEEIAKDPAADATVSKTSPLTLQQAQSTTGNAPGPDPGQGQTRQGGDPLSEKILWICGIATPGPSERENFSGQWARECKVPPQSYFTEWDITRVIITNAIVGQGSINVDGHKFERTSANADCERGAFETLTPGVQFGGTYSLQIPNCEMSNCPKSKCWSLVTYYGKTKQGKEEPPFLNSWKKSVQELPRGPVYLLEPAQDAQRKIATLTSAERFANFSCSTVKGSSDQCSEINLPSGSTFQARIEGSKCEDFGGYTSYDDCNQNHKPPGCDGRHMGNEGRQMLCWRGLGEAINKEKSPAIVLWKKLGLQQ